MKNGESDGKVSAESGGIRESFLPGHLEVIRERVHEVFPWKD